VPGRVNAVLVVEGQTVRAGQPLVSMISLEAASLHSAAEAHSSDARFQAVSAELRGESIGGAAARQSASAAYAGLSHEVQSSLVVGAPGDGTVLTRDPAALLGREVASGQPLLELADAGPSVVRIYIPVSGLERIHPGAEVGLALPDRFSIVRMPLGPLGSDAVSLPPGLVASQDYKGIKLPIFYCARMALPTSAGDPKFGTSGQAQIFGQRRSLAARFLAILLNLAKAHLW